MPKQTGTHYPRTINQYTPNMEFAADIVNGIHIATLGAPAALDADGIWDGVTADATVGGNTYTSADYKSTFDGSSTSLTTTAGMIDATYGRCLTAVGSAGSDHVLTITGRDYLGQLMKEQLTLSGTTVQYGVKAFKYVDTLLVAAGAASDTCDIGWSDVLGLPYAAEQLIGWSEDNVQKDVGRNVTAMSQAMVYATDASLFISSPTNGFITGLSSVSTIANTTAADALTIEVGGTTVAGLALSVLSTDTIGDSYTDFAGTNDHGATGKVAKGAGIEIVSDTGGTAGAGTVVAHLEENVRFIKNVTTDPQTATTGDPRGTVLPYTSCDGSVEYEVRYVCNEADLHGVEHFSG